MLGDGDDMIPNMKMILIIIFVTINMMNDGHNNDNNNNDDVYEQIHITKNLNYDSNRLS